MFQSQIVNTIGQYGSKSIEIDYPPQINMGKSPGILDESNIVALSVHWYRIDTKEDDLSVQMKIFASPFALGTNDLSWRLGDTTINKIDLAA